MFIRSIVVCLILVALAGCALSEAVFFSGDNVTSYKKDGAKITIEASASPSCDVPEERRTVAPAVVTVAPAVITAAVGIVLNIAESEIDTYIANKKKQFSATYSAVAASEPNSGAYQQIKDHNQKVKNKYQPFNCIHVQRTIKENDKEITAFDAYFALQTDGSGTSQRLVPHSVTLARAAALTDSKKRKVDVSVEIKIDVVAVGEKGPSKAAIVDQVINFPGLQTPGANEKGLPNTAVTIWDCSFKSEPSCQNFSGSGWFPAIPKPTATQIAACDDKLDCKGITPFDVAALVTETGTGADAFGTLGSDIDGNKSSVNSAITSYIQSLLTSTGAGK